MHFTLDLFTLNLKIHLSWVGWREYLTCTAEGERIAPMRNIYVSAMQKAVSPQVVSADCFVLSTVGGFLSDSIPSNNGRTFGLYSTWVCIFTRHCYSTFYSRCRIFYTFYYYQNNHQNIKIYLLNYWTMFINSLLVTKLLKICSIILLNLAIDVNKLYT